jgi:sulfite exporter TauE/SafE
MLKIGIVLLIIGYLIAPITQYPNSTTPIFWLGLLFVLRSKQLAHPEKYWTKGAMGGLLGHVLVFITIVIFGSGGSGFIGFLSYVYRPITYIAAAFFQHQYIRNPGSTTDITTLILAVTYNLLNICTYISIGVIIGKLSINKKVANLPHMLIIGIVLVTIGFFIAPIIQSASLSTPIFLLGFFLVLRSKQIANPANYWAKGAMWGVLVSIFMYFTEVFLGNVGYLYFFYSPISHIAETFFPLQYTQNSAGSITGITTLILAVTYKFLDICTYISIGAILGKLLIKQKSR